jgi:hypothetical protein
MAETGWEKVGLLHGKWMVYKKTLETKSYSGPVKMEIPLLFDAHDYPRCYWMVLDDLRKIEGRRIALIAKALKATENRLLDDNPMAGLETPVGNYTKAEWAELMKEINGDE